jgi:hypothetical protein
LLTVSGLIFMCSPEHSQTVREVSITSVNVLSMKKNPSAQDLLVKSQPMLGSLTTFRAAYPFVSKLAVEIEAVPMGFGRTESYSYSLENAPGQFSACPNRQCIGGGYDVGSFLQQLIAKRETKGEGGGGCRGHERMSRRDTRSCYVVFRAKAELCYAAEGGRTGGP